MKKKKRCLLLCLLLTVLLAAGLLSACGRKAEAGAQENSSELHSASAQAEQNSTQGGTGQQLILYDSEDLRDDVYAEDDEGGYAQENEDASKPDAPKPEEPKPSVIDENGSYTTKEDVALYIHTYGKLPSNFITKKEAEKLGWSGGSLEPYAPGKCIGGSHFGNYEGLLPDGRYKECDIDTLGKKSRGAKRIIYSDDGRIYYTDDHYESFTQLY